MNGKFVSIPFGMAFKKYYCSKCGEMLKKEKTHRVVTKDDKDYYQYHKHGTFPLRDYDVYGYRFKCPSCEARISYDDQCIIERIQKQRKCIVLSFDEIKENYESSRVANNKRILIRNVLLPVIFNFIAFAIFYFFVSNRTLPHFAIVASLFILSTLYIVFATVREYKGKGKIKINRSYSQEKKSQMERLHAYATHNKELIEKSDRCYCFHCKSIMESREIERYLEEKTALCPKCGIDSIIPDVIDESIDETVISEMRDYWF